MPIYNPNMNGKKLQAGVDPATPLLWVLREHLNLVGTKYGCGIAQCGACRQVINLSLPLKDYLKMAITLFRKPGWSMMTYGIYRPAYTVTFKAGLGEPLFPPVFAALANALHKATGKRLYEQPFGKQLDSV